MTLTAALALIAALGAAPGAGQHVHPTTTTQGGDATSALSADAVRQLLAGDGMGLALPAEMNHYPGPKHALELAQALGLSSDQQKEIEAIRREVLESAQRLGRSIVEAERALDAAFKAGTLSEEDLEARTQAIARLQGELRLVHLRAHVRTKPILTAEQVHQYYQLRKH
jgi:Spy/CpxP family protein refolding chaperone